MHLPIPDGLASDLAAPMLRGGVAVLKKCEAQKEATDILPCKWEQMERLRNDFDYSDKGDFAKECGATKFFDVTQYASNEDLVKAIKEAALDGLGAAAAIICTASNEA
ncbi:Hypothetical protein PENO1_026510 [Penicillium occitanis (nom. inval.)]|nr:Hypothetical protein PENO1_026510 [Penicillium occitanis (nom. inval.)]PCH05201.1 hypothetical protein PENOC_029830 [Penicillium occitanis (nom. inval.)]